MPNLLSHSALTAILLTFAATAQSRAQDEARAYTMATAQEGGTYYPVGVALAVLSSIHLEPAIGMTMEAVTSSGSLENLAMMREGEAQFGAVEVLAATWARDATGPFAEERPQTDLRAVTMLWSDIEHFLLRTSLAETGTIDDMAGLTGHGFSMGPSGSGIEASNRILFDNYGFEYEDWGLVNGTFDESTQSLLDGSIAGVNIGAGVGVSSVASVLAQMGEQLTLLSVTDEQAARLDGDLGVFSTTFLPVGTYAGIEEPVQTLTAPNFLAVNADVSDEDVYQFTKTMFENLEYLCDVHSAACGLSAEAAQAGLPVALHPGAARYFAEMGLTPEVDDAAEE